MQVLGRQNEPPCTEKPRRPRQQQMSTRLRVWGFKLFTGKLIARARDIWQTACMQGAHAGHGEEHAQPQHKTYRKTFFFTELISGHVRRAIRPPIRNFGYKFLTLIFGEENFG